MKYEQRNVQNSYRSVALNKMDVLHFNYFRISEVENLGNNLEVNQYHCLIWDLNLYFFKTYRVFHLTKHVFKYKKMNKREGVQHYLGSVQRVLHE